MVPGDPKCQWDMPVIVGVSVGQVISRVPSHHGSSVSKPDFFFSPVLKCIVRIDIFSS